MRNTISVEVVAVDSVSFGAKVVAIKQYAEAVLQDRRSPLVTPSPPIGPSPEIPDEDRQKVIVKKPFFRVGEATGAPGETVWVPVFGWCSGAMTGFHFGVGCGNWRTLAKSARLSKYLADYLQGGELKPFEGFQYIGDDLAVGPTAFCEIALGFFSIGGATWNPIPIPFDTELFRIEFLISPDEQPGTTLELIAKDLFWSTQDNAMKRNYEYTASPHAYTDINMVSGKITVV